MMTQLQFNVLVCGRQHSKIIKREDTNSSEGTTLVFSDYVFGRQDSTFRKREDITSSPLDSSVDCSETNVTIMQQITCECSSVVEAVCLVVFITIVIELV